VLGVLNVSPCVRGIECFSVLRVLNVPLCVRGIEFFSGLGV
jgi:hypothetical protein